MQFFIHRLQVYERLNVSILERGESFYQNKMKDVVEELTKRGVLEDDEGRKIMWAEKIEVKIIGKVCMNNSR